MTKRYSLVLSMKGSLNLQIADNLGLLLTMVSQLSRSTVWQSHQTVRLSLQGLMGAFSYRTIWANLGCREAMVLEILGYLRSVFRQLTMLIPLYLQGLDLMEYISQTMEETRGMRQMQY